MPMLVIKTVGQGGKLGIWHMTESPEQLQELRKNTAEDAKALAGFSHPQRKQEWLTARILVGEITGKKDAVIYYDEHSKPFLRGSSNHISLSHSHSLLAFLISENETGVDIELVKQKTERIKEKFMSPSELASVQGPDFAEQLTVYWCAKESLYKLYGKKELAFKEHLPVEPFQYPGNGRLVAGIRNEKMNKRFSLQFEKLRVGEEEYIITWVVGEV